MLPERDSSQRMKNVCYTRGNNDLEFSNEWGMMDYGFQPQSGNNSLQIPQIQYLMDRESSQKKVEEEYYEKKSQMSIEEIQKISIQSSNKGFPLFGRCSNFQEYQKSSIQYSQKQSLERNSMDYRNSMERMSQRFSELQRISDQSESVQRSSNPNTNKEELEIVLEWQEPCSNEQAIEELIQKLTLEKQPEMRPDRLSLIPQTKQGCICRKTHCLKFYCQCFQNGKMCTDQCECVDCKNNDENLELVEKTREIIMQKNPEQKEEVKCTCKKSRCLKKYCECYNSGQKCGDQCKCEGCMNVDVSKEELLRLGPELEMPYSKKVKFD